MVQMIFGFALLGVALALAVVVVVVCAYIADVSIFRK